MRIGFVGLGAMGGDQARCIAKAYSELSVYDSSRSAMDAFAGKARLADSLTDLGKNCEIVDVCVRTDAQVRAVIEGEGGLLDCMPKNSVIAVHSTVQPQTVIELAAKAAKREIALIDAPVTRTAFVDGEPFVFTMTGGPEEVTNRIRPVLETFSTDIMHAGPVGSGLVLKICNNLVALVEIFIGHKAFELVAAAGIDAEKLKRVMAGNGNLTPAMRATIERPERFKGTRAEMLAHVEVQVGNAEKDFDLAAQTAAQYGLSLPTALHVKELYRQTLLAI